MMPTPPAIEPLAAPNVAAPPSLSQPEPPQREERLALATIFGGVFLFLAGSAVREHWPRAAPEIERTAEHAFDYRVDLNAANEVELQHLPGIGPALAARIVADRAARGPFGSAADLTRVKGIGPKILLRMVPHIAALPTRD